MDQNQSIKIPAHLGIILDGNGRWAQRQGKKRSYGHLKGSENVVTITRACSDAGVKALSLYAFSTENWKRPIDEVTGLMELLVKFVREYLDELDRNGVRLTMMGKPDRLPFASRKAIEYAMNRTAGNTGMVLNIGLNYGGRDSILRSVKEALSDRKNPAGLTEEAISQHLETSALPDLDLVIRTGGEQRLSNFMIWEAAYAEFYFTEVLWPDFSVENLYQAFEAFAGRDRRYGGV